jgi:hypothetical protein
VNGEPRTTPGNSSTLASARWDDGIDEILGGDLTAAIGMPTAGGGVVLATVAPIGLRDIEAGTVSFTTSLGFGRKLERIHADPRIAIAYHTRRHGKSQRPGYVHAQGRATIRYPSDEAEREAIRARAADHLGQLATGRFWDWWLVAYYDDRVLVEIAVERLTTWDDDACRGEPTVLGAAPVDEDPADQRAPKDAAQPRVPVRRVVRSLRRLPHVLLGHLDADGMPVIVPVTAAERERRSILIDTAAPLPRGSRRAGLLAHDFHPGVVGLRTATHTGWLAVDHGVATWTPHSRHALAIPPSKTVVLLGNGAAARLGLREATKSGLASQLGLESPPVTTP